MKQKFYIGVDGGGTKTQAIVINEKGDEIGSGIADGSNPSVFGIKKATLNIRLSVLKAVPKGLKKIPAVFAIAGVNTKEEANNLKKAIFRDPALLAIISQKSQVVNDALAALRAGSSDKNAIVVIAGTGSSCYGRNEKGEEAKSGGFDFILSDEGSGYAIGLSILKAVTRAEDGRGPKTELVELLFKKFKLKSIGELNVLVYKKPWNKTDIAELAPLVEAAVRRGDKVAREIIKVAAHDLGIMIKTVAQKLGLKEKPYTIVTAGSVFNMHKILQEYLARDILEFSPQARFTKPTINSAAGAAFLAVEMVKD